MLAQVAGLALLSALSPTALPVTAVHMGSAPPGHTTLCYLAGAVVMSTAIRGRNVHRCHGQRGLTTR